MKDIQKFIKLLVLTMIQVFGDNKAIVVSVASDAEYDTDGKATGRVNGMKYEVVCPKMKYLSLVVKVPVLTPVITQEQIDASPEPIWITFDGFTARLYQMRGELGLTCKASKAIIVTDDSKTKG